jgi:hypothetical protein
MMTLAMASALIGFVLASRLPVLVLVPLIFLATVAIVGLSMHMADPRRHRHGGRRHATRLFRRLDPLHASGARPFSARSALPQSSSKARLSKASNIEQF